MEPSTLTEISHNISIYENFIYEMMCEIETFHIWKFHASFHI